MSFDYQVCFLDGMTVNEVVTENEDGSYTIFVNNNLCESKRMRALNPLLRADNAFTPFAGIFVTNVLQIKIVLDVRKHK